MRRLLAAAAMASLVIGWGAGLRVPVATAADGHAPAARLGGAPTGAGTLTADLGEIPPADPAKFHKEPA